MLQGLFKRAENTIDNAVAKIIGRVAVAVPLLIASGFASAALTVWLVERYGSIPAYAIMAALFSLIGLITMVIVWALGATSGETAPQASSSGGASSDAESGKEEGLDPLDLLTPEVRAILASATPMALPAIFRGVGRNLPLIFVLALVGFVISRFVAQDSAGDDAESSSGTGEGEASPEMTETEAAA